ncbi:DoxX family protein [Tautonia rosea]|uniref:DoxX family protein n=1 Tax=Tautonia rosea TaxID=2728037 RepID=UPI001475D9CA|nr:DoxX family protein [Tautonia rosea]
MIDLRQEHSADRRAWLFRGALGVATLTMLSLSWPIWVGSDSLFPRVPFLPGLPEPPWLRFVLFSVLVGSILGGILRRRCLLIGLLPLAYLIAGDQHRFQPWAYQYALMSMALGTLPSARALGLCRALLIALYVHSGLSKLDVTFPGEVGAAFLIQLTAPLGTDVMSWPGPVRTAAALMMPMVELLVGVGLAFRTTRPVALVGAVLMHATLITLLGPWGLDHSTIVVVWNSALIVEGLILFARTGSGRSIAPMEPMPRAGRVVVAVFALAITLPGLERWGAWDSWPSFALYASHAERVYVFLHEDDLPQYPDEVRRHLRPPMLGDPWHRLDLTSWSRAGRGTPPYPQARAAVGVAEALANRVGSGHPVRLVVWGRAARFSGRRERREAIGPEAIGRLADTFFLNAHPARSDG